MGVFLPFSPCFRPTPSRAYGKRYCASAGEKGSGDERGLLTSTNVAEIEELARIHTAFHEGAKRVFHLKNAGQVGNAEKEMLAVTHLTEGIYELLSITEQLEAK